MVELPIYARYRARSCQVPMNNADTYDDCVKDVTGILAVELQLSACGGSGSVRKGFLKKGSAKGRNVAIKNLKCEENDTLKTKEIE